MSSFNLKGRAGLGAQRLVYAADAVLESTPDGDRGRQINWPTLPATDIYGNAPGLGFPPDLPTDVKLSLIRGADGTTHAITHDGTAAGQETILGQAIWVTRSNGVGPLTRLKKPFKGGQGDLIVIER